MAYATSLAGSKLRAQLSSTLNERASVPTNEFAKRQLEKMGWTEGTGLGKKRQGRSTHIRVRRREDSVGLGHDKEARQVAAQQEQWWKDSMGDTLAKLSKKKKRKKQYTDDELFEATGGARFGMRAQKRATGKWARTESSISEADESEARARAEWNGQGVAETVLSTEKESSTESSESTTGVEETGGGSKRKRKKKDKKSEKGIDKKKKKDKKQKVQRRKESNM